MQWAKWRPSILSYGLTRQVQHHRTGRHLLFCLSAGFLAGLCLAQQCYFLCDGWERGCLQQPEEREGMVICRPGSPRLVLGTTAGVGVWAVAAHSCEQ